MTIRVFWFWHYFVKNSRFCIIYSFSNQNCNIISAYFLYFWRFTSSIYNSISTHSIDLPHNTTVRVLNYFCQKRQLFGNFVFFEQNLNRMSVYIFLSFTNQINNRITQFIYWFCTYDYESIVILQLFLLKRPYFFEIVLFAHQNYISISAYFC